MNHTRETIEDQLSSSSEHQRHREASIISSSPAGALEGLPEMLTVKQAASILGVTERSIYGYVHAGTLVGERTEKGIMVQADSVRTFDGKAPGQIRKLVPRWRRPAQRNQQWLTFVTLRQQPGQAEPLASRLERMRRVNSHALSGTQARYLVRNQNDPQEVTLVLVWRSTIMPPAEERAAALAALRADFAELFDCKTAVVKEGRSLLHA